MKGQLKKIIDQINISLVERETHTRLALLTALAGENLILVGPPGTAKSEISRRVAQAFDTKYFEYLLTKFTTPEELFGPVSIKELEQDNFRRKTEGYLSDANIVFLDEIFKSNSSILNSLLTILNEKIYHNGNLKEETDIYSIISASNELPRDSGELMALYDRFLVRVVVDYVKDPEKLLLLENNYRGISKDIRLTREILDEIREKKEGIKVPPHVVEIILKLKSRLDERFEDQIAGQITEKISDRKLVKSIGLLKTSAYTNGRDRVNLTDTLLLLHCYWNRIENRDIIKDFLFEEIIKLTADDIKSYEDIAGVWTEEFNSIFAEQRVDQEGNKLYYDAGGQLTKVSYGDIHVRDKYGDYIFFKGHPDYVKVLAELGKFDHGYIESGIVTDDGKIVWNYEFSPVEVATSSEKSLEDYERLVVKGNLKEATIGSYEEYMEAYDRIDAGIIPKIEGIRRNIEDERVNIRKAANYLRDVKTSITGVSNLWVEGEHLDELLERVDTSYDKLKGSLERLEEILRKIDTAKSSVDR